jgi:eukaryotic-like serine/threonine-protein kinase
MNGLRLLLPSRAYESVFLAMVFAVGLLTLYMDWSRVAQQALYHAIMRADLRLPHEQLVLVTIDDASLQQLGDLPWSRHHYAELIQQLAPHAQHIALLPPLTQTQLLPGRAEAHALLTFYQHNDALKPQTDLDQNLLTLHDLLLDLRHQLDGDQQLLNVIKQYSPKITLAIPTYLSNNPVQFDPSVDLSTMMDTQMAIETKNNEFAALSPAIRYLFLPFPYLANSAPLAVMPLNAVSTDRIPLLARYQQQEWPTLPLVLLQQIKAHSSTRFIRHSHMIQLADWTIPTDSQAQLYSRFYPESAFNTVSFIEVLNGSVAAESFQDKIVLIGITALPYSIWQNTPFGEQSSLHWIASGVSSVLENDFFYPPPWAALVYYTVMGIFGVYLIFFLPRLPLWGALSATGLLFSAAIALNALLLKQNWLVSLLGLCGILIFCHGLFVVQRALTAYRTAMQELPDAFSSHRLLGLAFQGQGQLDLAFSAFRRCPWGETVKGELYNLALDYEQQRQNERAIEVYRYLIQQDPRYRDVERQLARLLHPHATPDDKPRLGRYQLERCLSKGAMGTVYLARDAKLDRLVAIKTLALAREFSTAQWQEALIRFFREAAAVGRLRHPHIIHIYDAGEEEDLAYLCMEFFKGNTLVPYTHADNLLPKKTLLELMMTTAQALHYAHQQGVIHRDIKPSNIMYNPGNGQLKVTDFGIARITDTQRTRTGLILGTPAYMSPEQLSGQSLDGRTDLFSFGVMLYQLLSGYLPFQADNMTTLMYRIIHEPPVPLSSYRSDLSAEWLELVDRLLAKSPDERFSSGEELVQALCVCLQKESPCH